MAKQVKTQSKLASLNIILENKELLFGNFKNTSNEEKLKLGRASIQQPKHCSLLHLTALGSLPETSCMVCGNVEP